ncbi:hypothetical protein [Pelomonas sp. KK5]|uniref:hypothetical protein n=1 Tax=Pelomonas sp. KK5 TaxID=1855730 RepID=UPI00097CA191|nr:hypothetical protein [Pelomonas sp. KK5]
MKNIPLFLIGTLMTSAALAQGGPPMVTDDPGTPGDGHWEINIGAIHAHARSGARELAAPDADINYGWGEHIQLKADIPWVTVGGDGMGTRSGLGDGDFGVKWRFVDEETAGYSLSTYPQYTRNLLGSSNRRGITSKGHSFFLPVELSADIGGGFSIAAELGRNFVSAEGAKNEWVGGFVLAHDCGEGVECMGEIHHTTSPGSHQTLLNFGLHWKLQESVTLLAAAGREFGTRSEEQLKSLVYVGLQFTR